MKAGHAVRVTRDAEGLDEVGAFLNGQNERATAITVHGERCYVTFPVPATTAFMIGKMTRASGFKDRSGTASDLQEVDSLTGFKVRQAFMSCNVSYVC